MRLLCFLLFFSISAMAAPSANSLHLDWIDKKVDSHKDFFSYANGNWQKQNPIPSAYPSWNNFYVLQDINSKRIKKILETLAVTSHKDGSIEQKLGDFYYSGMDQKTIDATGAKPLQPIFEKIDGLQSRKKLPALLAYLHLRGVDAIFNFGQMQDFKDNTHIIGVATQGGIGLPDRDYYLKSDKKFILIRKAYATHIQKMFLLLGEPAAEAAHASSIVLKIETALAQAALPRAQVRDPKTIYHPMNSLQLQNATPHFSWEDYITALGHPEMKNINLAMPDFFAAMDAAFVDISISEWKAYLRWHVLTAYAPFLSEAFVKQNFNMASTLLGVKTLLPRWKRVVLVADGALGFAIGQLYVEKYFQPASKKQAEEMIDEIRAALKADLQNLDWMSAPTRKAALKKLSLMKARVGYPQVWRDYSALTISRVSYAENIMRINMFLNQRELNKIGKGVDKNEWEMTPQTVNAYYDAAMNTLNIPAGILQPPFFDPDAPAAVNYGAIGFVIGHEMTHGFDDQGAQFDEKGNLKNWWSNADLKKFQHLTAKIADQFSKYPIAKNSFVQGQLVQGEAAADLGGLVLAYRAFRASKKYADEKVVQGYTPDQQFFLSASHIWANNVRPEEAQRLALIDSHPPAKYRVNGAFANMPEFKIAYGGEFNKAAAKIW